MSVEARSAPAWARWQLCLASAPIVYHLGAVLLGAIVAPSGPWPTPEGPQVAMPPPAASLLHDTIGTRRYLQAIGLNNDYHFPSNRVSAPDAYLEVVLEDEDGSKVKSLRYPDPDAPYFVRYRQARLIRWLIEDLPIAPLPATERIYPPGKPPARVAFWDQVEPRRLVLAEVLEPEVPRGRPLVRPAPWSMVVLRSLARHACREHGAAHARILRHSKEALSPEGLMDPRALPPEMDELVSDYGRMSK